jgi:hypothetical protein
MIEIRFRLTSERVRSMTATEAATLGLRIQDATRKLVFRGPGD